MSAAPRAALCGLIAGVAGCGADPAAFGRVGGGGGGGSDLPGTMAVPMDSRGVALTPASLPAGALAALGTWYLDDGGAPATLRLACASDYGCAGSFLDSTTGISADLDEVRWIAARGEIAFRWTGAGRCHHYRLRTTEGVLLGRAAVALDYLPEPADPRAWTGHVTGWRAETFDAELAPRVFDVTLDSYLYATLRLDRRLDPNTGAPVGDPPFEARIKVYASSFHGAADESDEYDAVVDHWDGTLLDLHVDHPAFQRAFHGQVSGRRLAGSFVIDGRIEEDHSFHGTRAEVLSHGFAPMNVEERSTWQALTRRRLELLMMNGAPAPLDVKATIVQSGVAPQASRFALPDRDDDPVGHPQAYRLAELTLDATLPDANNGPDAAPLTRRIHGWYSVPAGEPPAGGFPAVLAVNGHTGSAAQTFSPDSEYFWYGDAYARRGYAVLSIDISHRPVADRRGLYDNFIDGDDPTGGNGSHPSIHSPEMDSEWVEDGERLWDVQRGLDWLITQPGVDAQRVFVSGISMGGEMTTIAAAMDPRFQGAVAAGFSPDLSTLLERGSHGCWQWIDGDIRDYLDTSDLHALVAPRPLIVETGKADVVYSIRQPPFAADKQVMRRSRSAWADAPGHLVHYLHYDTHHFHVGAANPARDTEQGVRVPAAEGPAVAGDTAWQSDPETVDLGLDLFHLLPTLFGP